MKNHPQDYGSVGESFSLDNPHILRIEGLTEEENRAMMELLRMDLEEG